MFYFRNSEPDGQNAIFLIFDIRTVNHKVMMQSFTDLCEFVRGMYDHYEATLPVVPEDDEQPDVPVEPAVPETPVSKEPEPVASASGAVSGWAPGDVDWSKMVVDDSDDDTYSQPDHASDDDSVLSVDTDASDTDSDTDSDDDFCSPSEGGSGDDYGAGDYL